MMMLENTAIHGSGRYLRNIPSTLMARFDEKYNGTGSLVLELDKFLATRDAPEDASAAANIVDKIKRHLCGSSDATNNLSREGFLVANGHTLLQRILQIPIPKADDPANANTCSWTDPLPQRLAETLNSALHTLTELCTTHQKQTASLSRIENAMPRLFTLMRHKDLIDAALGSCLEPIPRM
eukprot:SAG31_NODE_1328_length_8747_cov_11.561474_2_plen_182_part_00